MSTTEVSTQAAQFGMIGLGVMGENLALNVEDHGFTVAVWNLEGEWVDRFIGEHGSSRRLTGTKTFEEFTREAALREENLNFFGMGVSGGEEGARFGPSLMPGGKREAYEHVRPILEKIA